MLDSKGYSMLIGICYIMFIIIITLHSARCLLVQASQHKSKTQNTGITSSSEGENYGLGFSSVEFSLVAGLTAEMRTRVMDVCLCKISSSINFGLIVCVDMIKRRG